MDSFGKSKEYKQELQNLRKTEELFRKALENAGVEYINNELEKNNEESNPQSSACEREKRTR